MHVPRGPPNQQQQYHRVVLRYLHVSSVGTTDRRRCFNYRNYHLGNHIKAIDDLAASIVAQLPLNHLRLQNVFR